MDTKATLNSEYENEGPTGTDSKYDELLALEREWREQTRDILEKIRTQNICERESNPDISLTTNGKTEITINMKTGIINVSVDGEAI